MKKLMIIIITLHTSLLTLHTDAQWYPQYSGTSEYLNSVCFTDTLNGWVVGNNGIILHTENGGNTWDVCASGTDEILTGVYFTDPFHGWIAGYTDGWIDEGFIYRTLDGGGVWERIDLDFSYPDEIYFSDTLNGWTSCGFLHTDDGGESWESQLYNYSAMGGVCFTDSQTGWIAGSAMNGSTGFIHSFIVHTNDGGITWEYQFDISSRNAPFLFSVYFSDSLNGWSAGGFYQGEIVFKTIDGGNNWDTAYYYESGGLHSISFVDAFNGWAVGYNGSIISTTDGGNSWESEPSGTTCWLKNVYFTDNGYGWIVGEEGTILHANYSQIVGMDEFESKIIKSNVRCYPNPTSCVSSFRIQVSGTEHVTLKLYDLYGREMGTVVDRVMPAGEHVVRFDASWLPAGVYIYQESSVISRQSSVGKLIKY